MSERKRKRVIVPLVLAVTTMAATVGCKSTSKPHVDAGTGDAPPDIPLI